MQEDTRKVGVLSHLGPVPDSIPLRLEAGDIVLISNSEFYTHIAKLGTLSVVCLSSLSLFILFVFFAC